MHIHTLNIPQWISVISVLETISPEAQDLLLLVVLEPGTRTIIIVSCFYERIVTRVMKDCKDFLLQYQDVVIHTASTLGQVFRLKTLV